MLVGGAAGRGEDQVAGAGGYRVGRLAALRRMLPCCRRLGGALAGFGLPGGGKRRKGVEFRGSVVERARWQGERSGGVSLGGERSRRTVYPGVRRREGGERSGGEKTERRGCDELTTLRSGAPPRCTADTCQLANLSACWEVGELESWRGAGGAGGVIAECSDCIVLSVRVGGFSWFTPG